MGAPDWAELELFDLRFHTTTLWLFSCWNVRFQCSKLRHITENDCRKVNWNLAYPNTPENIWCVRGASGFESSAMYAGGLKADYDYNGNSVSNMRNTMGNSYMS